MESTYIFHLLGQSATKQMLIQTLTMCQTLSTRNVLAEEDEATAFVSFIAQCHTESLT